MMSKSPEAIRVLRVIVIAMAIIAAVIVGYKELTPTVKETKVGLLVFKPATVRNLVTEFATYSDGDGIKISGKALLLEGVDAKKFFPDLEGASSYAVYRLQDPKHPKFEVFLASKRTLQGNETQEFSCVLHKFSRNDKYLVDTKLPEENP